MGLRAKALNLIPRYNPSIYLIESLYTEVAPDKGPSFSPLNPKP